MCLSPLLAIKYNYKDPDTGKYIVKIVGKVLDVNDLTLAIGMNELARYSVQCGQCIECRLNYARMWADRIMLESKYHECNQFITLTYDNAHLSINTFVNKEGTYCHSETLLPDDLQKFLKDLRRYYEYHYNHYNIRFYACGEYGDLSGRPHFHLILFNLPIEDKKLLFNKDGYSIYTSEIIEKVWKKGLITVADVCWESASYTARYVLKKQKGKNAEEYYKERGINPEFVRMSRRPGIGQNYFDDNYKKIYEYDKIVVKNGKGDVLLSTPPRFFDTKFEKIDEERLHALKVQRRKTAELIQRFKDEQTDKTFEQYCLDKLDSMEKRTQVLKFRQLIEI